MALARARPAAASWQELVSIADTCFDGLGHPAIQYAARPVDDPVVRLDARSAAAR